ncbi:response regulator [Pantanalinema sp. GBBB05]|uniref:response regulator n=1 Tax=Pantanalinema sp. GBBB05 TaxID=2604139 RepID=UPI001DB57951|nr:response regulator [Pantanalinema sp. GBBB05]
MTALANLSLLVVDDDFDSRLLLTYILEEEGANVTTAASAAEALQVLVEQHPDVLLSDLAMPDTDGYVLIHQIRSQGLDRGGLLPAIAVSALTGEESCQLAISAGYQRCVAKPIDHEELVNAIRDLAAQPHSVI